ncbi:hypothetical protein [Actinoalloteichus sp. GBA129-24]|uniref:VG15 protein n=1 Tax=Actinoalloteichus sp. GBA129-24 TaxID=1612551 RepID=UPI00095067F7|nr:hypothetical protein [Actinoalloteichus sp. GBA129-24]APU20940.1 hypothetical protein UA75_14650 [Actinoalloteichus sp. GBA129-24]APU24189.1 hypothetical protein UA75_31130 [Actinoalloteichus sp. GBA129-24]
MAQSHASQQQAYQADALSLVLEAMDGWSGDPDAWLDRVRLIGDELLRLQVLAAALADAYLSDVLDMQGADPRSDGEVDPSAFADLTDGGGSWLRLLVYAPTSVARIEDGIDRARWVAQSIALTGMQDVGRSAVSAAMWSRRAATGYVRMLVPPSCARCAILAGRVYRRVTAFRRHPRCDCRHVPQAEDSGDDWSTDPATYFRSLSDAEQDRIFTSAGAQAIRDGADISQVVNARSGITTVTAYGRTVQATTTGTTTRGTAGQRLAEEAGTDRDGRNRRARTPRLMPDEIYQAAELEGWSRDEVLRQLFRFGYII